MVLSWEPSKGLGSRMWDMDSGIQGFSHYLKACTYMKRGYYGIAHRSNMYVMYSIRVTR